MEAMQSLIKLAHQDLPLPLAWRVRCLIEAVSGGQPPPATELPLLESVQLSAADLQQLSCWITWKEANP